MKTWEDKVERVIGKLSYAAWFDANHDRRGGRDKKHRPYSLPEEAVELVECLGDPNRKRAEHRAKALMEGLRRAGEEID